MGERLGKKGERLCFVGLEPNDPLARLAHNFATQSYPYRAKRGGILAVNPTKKQKSKARYCVPCFFGSPNWARTLDPMHTAIGGILRHSSCPTDE